MTCGRAALALALVAVSSRPLAAQPARAGDARIVAALPAPSGDLAATSLVGRSGEIYEPTTGGLQRRAAGGVAPSVLAIVRGDTGTLWAIASRAPPFRRGADGVWQAVPLGNRGSVAAATGAARFAIGRHVYALEKDVWKRVVSAPARVVQLAAAGKESFLALGDGRAFRLDGTKLVALDTGLAKGETVTALFADRRSAIIATSAGRWLRLGPGKPRVLELPTELTGVVAEAGAADGSTLVIAGVVPGGNAPSYRLCRVDGERLTSIEVLPTPANGDAYAVVATGSAGAVLVATARGQVRRRRGTGAWTEVPLLPDALPVHAIAAEKAPSRSR